MRMIPPIISPNTVSNAERRLFDALSRLDLPADWCCLHSVDLPEHEYKVCGELDFVIVGPRGLYILEVKGGDVTCQDGIWYFTNRWGVTTRKSESPFEQARSGMFSLRQRLQRFIPEHELSDLVMGFGVVFPDIDFTVESAAWPREVVLDHERWYSQGLASYLKALATYWHAKLAKAPARSPSDLVRRVVTALRPDFELVRSLQVQSEAIERRVVHLTNEQYERLDLMEEWPRLLIEGGAGTGKTFLAIEMARRHAATGRRVLFVCFSPILAAFLQTQTQGLDIRVASVHNLMLYVIMRRGAIPGGHRPDLALTHPWYRETLVPAFRVAAAATPEPERYDVLIVDEAQDILSLDYLTALGGILRGSLENGTWRIFFDPFNQGPIFGAVEEGVIDILRSIATAAPRLKVNCRNTDPIVVQTKLMTGADTGSQSCGPGPEVVFATYRDEDHAAELLEEHLEELARHELAGRGITILSPRPYEQSSASRLSAGWRRRLTVLDEQAAWRFPFTGLTFATVADFKGLENAYIALTDIDDLDSSPAALATVYVGMTRARVGLWVALDETLKDRQKQLMQQHLASVLKDMKHGR